MIKDYWEEQHKQQNRKALTGSTIHQYCKLFKLTEQCFEGKCGLEIGVGLGAATKQLSELLANLDVLDISETAIKNVGKYIRDGYLDSARLPKDTYDIAISYLVAQHMSDVDLLNQLKNVVASMKESGHLYLQWAYALHGDNPQTIEIQQGGGILRSTEKMFDLIHSLDAAVSLVSSRAINSNVIWYAAQVRRIL